MNTKPWRERGLSALFLALVLLLGGVLFFIPRGCQAASTYKVSFRENSGGKGTDNCMVALTRVVKKGKTLIIPELPEKTGYLSLGWTSVKKGTTAEYQPGDVVPIAGNTVFYAVRQKKAKCKVKFRNNKGTSGGSPYKELNATVYAGDSFTLPEVPPLKGKEAVGWTTTKAGNAPLFLPGTTVTVEDSIYYYAVHNPSSSITLSFFTGDGETNANYSVLNKTAYQGSSVQLPEVEPDPGCTFLGWSLSRGRETNPEYLAGSTITLQKSLNLYAVMFPTSKEQDITSLPVGWQQVYRKVIFVGDSRINRMNQTLKVAFGLSPNLVEIHYVCAEGKGLSWLKQTGMDQLTKLVGYGVKPAAVVFNLGVNDLSSAKKYCSYLKSVKEELISKNCQLYYMSVNPVSHPLLLKTAKSESAQARTAAKVMAFNETIRTNLCSNDDFTYLDLYHYLISTGFRFDGGGKDGKDNMIEDGLHYSGKTYKRIYARTISLLLGQS